MKTPDYTEFYQTLHNNFQEFIDNYKILPEYNICYGIYAKVANEFDSAGKEYPPNHPDLLVDMHKYAGKLNTESLRYRTCQPSSDE